MVNLGQFNAGIIGSKSFNSSGNTIVRTTDAGIANGNAFLISELEKRDNLLREPLTSVTYPRDIPVKVGGGWVEFISSLSIDYGITGGSNDGPVTASGANMVPVIQANLDKDTFKAHVFAAVMRIMFVDMQRSSITSRSLDQMLTDGIRLAYDKHMDGNAYTGIARYGTAGILNNANVVASPVATGTGGGTAWSGKAPEEILRDVNTAIQEGWAAAEYDLTAMPNHMLIPYEQYNIIATTKVSDIAEKTILTFLLENNIAKKNGVDLVIGATQYCKGAGAGSTDRMAVYVNNDRFIAMEELVPLGRTMTQPNTEALSYDSVYMANISEVEIFYDQPIRYYDGI